MLNYNTTSSTIKLIDNIENIDDLNKLLSQDKNHILWFGATWCKPCKELELMINDLCKNKISCDKDINIYKISVDNFDLDEFFPKNDDINCELSNEINKLPTLVLLNDSKEIIRMTGTNKDDFNKFILNIGELKIELSFDDDF